MLASHGSQIEIGGFAQMLFSECPDLSHVFSSLD
jgi:hypothetical protein